MKFKTFRTRQEVETMEAEGELGEIVERYEIVEISDAERARLKKIGRSVRAVEQRAKLSRSRKKNQAASHQWAVSYAMDQARKIQPDCTAVEAIKILSAQPFPINAPYLYLEEFLDLCVEALLAEDAKLFDALSEIASLPKTDGFGKSVTLRKHGNPPLVKHAHEAFYTLQQQGIAIPTKKQVRDLAVDSLAKANVLQRIPFCNSPFDWKNRDESQYPSTLIAAIRTERERLGRSIESKPARFWTDTGLKDLPEAPKGRRKHRRIQ